MGKFLDLYTAPFRLLAVATRTFIGNRNRMRSLLTIPMVAKSLRFAMVLTVLVWLVIAFLATDEDKNRLNEAAKAFWPGLQQQDDANNGPTDGPSSER